MVAEPTPVAPGDTIEGRYRIVKRLDEGGMGTVFLAEHVLIKRKVAIKVLRSELASDAEVVERFMNEARAAGTLGHPNIVESTDMGFTKEGIPYIVFEFLEGALLVDEVYRLHGLTVRRALKIAHQIASALHAAHQAGIVHRDLKSENIFLITKEDRTDHVKVLDFGISRFMEVESDSNKRNTVMGTPEFMAPEQITSPEKVDRRADIYALGVIIYEMLSARRPFRDDDPQKVLHQVIHDKPPPLGKGDAPPGLSEMILDKLLAKDPDDRYPTMKELQGALEAFFNVVRPSNSMTPISIPDHVVKAAMEAKPEPKPDAPPPKPVPETPTPTAAAEVMPSRPTAKPSSKLPLVIGGIAALAVVGGIAFKLASGGGKAAKTADTPAAQPASTGALAGDADKLAQAIEAEASSARARADGLATSPMVRAGIETDAATVRDLANSEHLFTPRPGEVVEVVQIHGENTALLLRLPNGPQLPTPKPGQAALALDGGSLIVVSASQVQTQAGAVGGAIVVGHAIDLAPIKAALSEHALGATLVGLAQPLELVKASKPGQTVSVHVPLPKDIQSGDLSLSVVVPAGSAARNHPSGRSRTPR